MSFLDNLPKPFFVLAPLDDVTDTVFRQVIASCYPPDVFFTEFVNVDGLQSPGREKLLHKLRFTPKEQPLVAQFWGKNPDNFYKTAQQVANGTLDLESSNPKSENGDAVQGISEERTETYVGVRRGSAGADDIVMRSKHGGADSFAGRQTNAIFNFEGFDLNMGCPDKAVCNNGCCSALINDRELAKQIIDASREGLNGKLPLSVKTRIGYNQIDLSWIEFLLEQKLNMLTIHARTKKEMSKVPNHFEVYEDIVKMRDKISPNTLLIANGDILNRAHGEQVVKKYGVDGVMIGRGVFSDPFAFSDKSPWASWTKEQKIELYKKHVQLFQQTYEESNDLSNLGGVQGAGEKRTEVYREYSEGASEPATQQSAKSFSGTNSSTSGQAKTVRKVITLNKFCKIYINGFDGAKELREQLMSAKSTDELLLMLA